MSDLKHRRFSGFQIIFHWAVAVPYMLLLCSGALLILRRLGFLTWVPGKALGILHRWVGIALLVLLVQLFVMGIAGGQLRAVLKDLAEWCRFRLRDVLWLMMVPLNTLLPRRFHLPPMGRYNAGQKLHGVFIVCGICTFGLTGLLIMFRPGDIRPWIVHSWLFFGALAFLVLHLFLGLINPPTRQALPGIFTGHVSFEYVKDHHPLVLAPDPPPSRPHAAVSMLAAAITSLVVISGASALVWYYGPQRSQQRIMQLVTLEHPMVSPGPLAKSHANDPRTATCEVCHESLKPPSRTACLSCHSEIATVLQQQTGYHGQLTGECRTCHADHRGADVDLRGLDTRAFNHELARFHLDGKHQALQCDQCHVEHSESPGQRRFIGLRFASCADCHADPHGGQFEHSECATCHNEQGWKGKTLLFDHNRDASFKLDSTHRKLECAACHTPAEGVIAFRTLPTACEQCHTSTVQAIAGNFSGRSLAADPHNGRVKCADCHTPEADSPSAQTFAQACASCHNPRYRSLFFEWQKSLAERLAAAQGAIDHTNAADPEKAQALTARVKEARRVGFHNLSAATKALSEISSGQNPATETNGP